MVSTAKGGRPVFARGQYGSTICTKEVHGTTRSISSKNSRLRDFFVDRFRPSPSCFITIERLPKRTSTHASNAPVLQTFPNRRKVSG
jgi:hypothetical protein